MKTRSRAIRFLGLSAAAGVISALVFLAIAELVALVVARASSPLLAVGSVVIDIVPQPLKEFAIAAFGENDKVVLLGSLGLAVAVASALAGILEYLRPPLGAVVLCLAGVLSAAAILTRADVSPFAWLVPAAGTAAGVLVLRLLSRLLRTWQRTGAPRPAAAAAEPGSEAGPGQWSGQWSGSGSEAPSKPERAPGSGSGSGSEAPSKPERAAPTPDRDFDTADDTGAPVGRRSFLIIATVAAASAVLIGVGARITSGAVSSIEALRSALRLPSPRRVVEIPTGAELDIRGLSPLITPNEGFYRVDTALTVPQIDPATWRLTIDGMVENPVTLSFDDLIDRGLDEYAITMTCVSNEVGGELLGNAIWLGVPVRDILASAVPLPGADMVLSRSIDGFTASTPLESLTDDALDAILAVGMNGEPLPLEHGFPVRMVVPGLYGYVSATKWLTSLTLTTFEADQAYWTPRGYSARAPIKLSSRIDTPRSGAPIPSGTTAIAGMAWAQPVGVQRVEVSIDDGPWREAALSTPLNASTWVQWHLQWDAAPGTHYLSVRATDADGMLQIENRAPIAPDGSTGWQRTLITVR